MSEHPSRIPPLVDLAVVGMCMFMDSILLKQWHNHHDFPIPGEIMFLIWLSPIFMIRTIHWNKEHPIASCPPLSFVGLIICGLGWFGSFNVFKQFGMAMAITSLFPVGRFTPILLIGALSWMHAGRWFLKPVVPYGFEYVQISVALLVPVLYFLIYHKKRIRQYE